MHMHQIPVEAGELLKLPVWALVNKERTIHCVSNRYPAISSVSFNLKTWLDLNLVTFLCPGPQVLGDPALSDSNNFVSDIHGRHSRIFFNFD
jgi:hypothetical protein